MARSNRQDLYLSVNGDVRGLQSAAKAGRTVLNEFAGAAVNVLEEVEREFNKIGAGGAPAGLKEAERAYVDTFRRIGDAARAASNDNTGQSALQILDANAARDAAAAATSKAAALRLVAEAATRADQANGGNSAATRAYAVAASTAAVEAERESVALREQAAVLGQVEAQLGSVGRAQVRTNATSGQTRAGFQQLSYQLGDISMQYSLGTSASVIFAQQSGQVIQALQMINAEGNAVLRFLGGPWGIALSSALVVATPFVAKLFEGGDALGKETEQLRANAEKAGVAAQAKKAFATTEAGLIDDVRSLTEEIEKQNEALKTNAERLNIRAKNRLELLRQRRDEVQGELADAKADADAAALEARRNPEGGAVGEGIANQRVTEIEGRLARVDDAIKKAEAARQRTRAELAGEAAKRATDDPAAINYKYDGPNGLIENAKKRALAEGTVTAQLTRQLELLEEARATELANVPKKGTAGPLTTFRAPVDGRITGDFGEKRPDHQHAGIDYAVPVGTPVRAPAAGVIDVAGQKQGYGNAIYINFGGGTTGRFGHLSKFNVRPGDRVEAGDIIGYSGGAAGAEGSGRSTGPHLHYELRRNGKAVDPRKGKFPTDIGGIGDGAARRQQADENRATQNADAYASLLAQAKEAQYRVERSRFTTIEESARLDAEAVDRQRADLDRAVQKGVELERWTQAEADAVKAINAQNAEAEKAAIAERARAETAARRADLERDALEDEASLLRLQGDLAATAADRRAIARRLLKIEQDMVEAALRSQIAGERDPVRRAGLQRRLEQVPQEYELRGQQVDRQSADPLQAYQQRLVDATGDINTALKGVAADGFKAFEDASTDAVATAVSNMLGLKGVVGDVVGSIIRDLIRLAVQTAILKSLGGIFGAKDGGLAASAAAGSNAAINSYISSIPAPRFANGGIPSISRGIIRGAGTGRSDSILALVGGVDPILVSNGEGIVNEQAVRNYWPLIDAMNRGDFPRFADGGLVAPALPRWPSISTAQRSLQPPAPAAARPVTFDLRGAVMTQDLLTDMQRIATETSGQVVHQSAPAIVEAATTNTLARMRRPTL